MQSIMRGYLSVVSLFLFFSCVERKEYKYETRETLEVMETFDIQVPDNFIEHSKWGVFQEEEKWNLFEFGITKDGDLLIFPLNFRLKSYEPSIYIPLEGPDGFNAPDVAVQIINRDSILVFPIPSTKFLLYNWQGEKLQEFPMPVKSACYVSGFFSSAYVYANWMHVPTNSLTIRYDASDYFKKVAPIYQLDLQEMQWRPAMQYPIEIQGRYLWSTLDAASLMPYRDSLALVNFRFSDSLYVFNPAKQTYTSFWMGINSEGLLFTIFK